MMADLAFIHIVKTGGTYVIQCQSPIADVDCGVIYPLRYLSHSYIVDSQPELSDPSIRWPRNSRVTPADIKDRMYFSVVRNPFAVLVSLYEMRRKESVNGSFGVYLARLCDRRTRPLVQEGSGFMFCQLFRSGGSLIVDYIGRQETMDADLRDVAMRADISYRSGCPRRHEGSHHPSGKTADWQSYYTKEMVATVRSVWRRELRMFGYDEKGLDENRALLPRVITKDERREWRYDIRTDRLTFRGDTL